MKNPQNFLLLLVLLIGFTACKDKTSTENETRKSDPVRVAKQAEFLSGMDCKELVGNTFCAKGFPFIKLGEELTWAVLKVEGASVIDTVYEEITNIDTFAWNVKEVRSEKGRIILESDFNTYKLLARVRIEDPQYRNQHGIGVGSTVGELKNTYDSFQLSPYPEMDVVEINLEGNSNIFIHVADPNHDLLDMNAESWSIEDLPDDAKIVRIVLWDNTVGTPQA